MPIIAILVANFMCNTALSSFWRRENDVVVLNQEDMDSFTKLNAPPDDEKKPAPAHFPCALISVLCSQSINYILYNLAPKYNSTKKRS